MLNVLKFSSEFNNNLCKSMTYNFSLYIEKYKSIAPLRILRI